MPLEISNPCACLVPQQTRGIDQCWSTVYVCWPDIEAILSEHIVFFGVLVTLTNPSARNT